MLARLLCSCFSSLESTIALPYNASSDDVQLALNGLIGPNGAPVVTEVTSTGVLNVSMSVKKISHTVKFISPVDDVNHLVIVPSSSPVVTVVEAVKGISPIQGTFTVFFEGEYTDDIDYDASAATMKDALEDLSKVGRVQVSRDDLGNGYKWTVTFTQNVGNLRMMEPSDYRYEIQKITTEGGAPTPLSGELILTFGNDSRHCSLCTVLILNLMLLLSRCHLLAMWKLVARRIPTVASRGW